MNQSPTSERRSEASFRLESDRLRLDFDALTMSFSVIPHGSEDAGHRQGASLRRIGHVIISHTIQPSDSQAKAVKVLAEKQKITAIYAVMGNERVLLSAVAQGIPRSSPRPFGARLLKEQ